jgi:tRNA U34 2-thiouridine synthase MnmA/TrmU
MPFTRINLRQGYSDAQITQISDILQQCLEAEFAVPPGDRFQLFEEMPARLRVFDRQYKSGGRSDKSIQFHILAGKPRSREQKQNLCRRLCQRLQATLDLITAKKKDSTGICFIGERKFREFLGRYLPAQPGKIVTVDGEEIGQHQGLMYHTLGQRKGLGIGGTKEGSEDPWYVVDKDVENNILIVAQGHDHPRLMSVGLIAQQLHWVDREPVKGTLRCTVKTRYRQTDIPCTITAIDDERIEVRFDEPVSAVTPGQSAVFYSGEICLGGGIIEQRLPLTTD